MNISAPLHGGVDREHDAPVVSGVDICIYWLIQLLLISDINWFNVYPIEGAYFLWYIFAGGDELFLCQKVFLNGIYLINFFIFWHGSKFDP